MSHNPPRIFRPLIDPYDYATALANHEEDAYKTIKIYVHDTFAILCLGSLGIAYICPNSVDVAPLEIKTVWGLDGQYCKEIRLLGYSEDIRCIRDTVRGNFVKDPAQIRTQTCQYTFTYCTVWHGAWTIDRRSSDPKNRTDISDSAILDRNCTDIEITAARMIMKSGEDQIADWTIFKSASPSFQAMHTKTNTTISCSMFFHDYNHITLSISTVSLERYSTVGTIALIRKE
jgi:hypothetical protein